MNKLGFILMGCAVGVAACSHLREPDDVQLLTLLHTERAPPTDPSATLDSLAVNCLRAWSNDAELSKGLPVRIAGEDGRKTCRARLDGWIADAARNPDKLSFDEISAPATVRRAMSLLATRALAAQESRAARRKPTAAAPVPVPAAPVVTASSIDLGAAGAELREAETLCQQAAEATAKPDANPNLRRFASSCAKSLRKLRTTMETAAKAGKSGAQLEPYAVGARNMANAARNLLAAPKS